MMRKPVVLVALAILSCTLGATRAVAYEGAPYFAPNQPYAQNFPDPSVVWDATTGRYYAFATTTGGVNVPAMWSTDLVTWTAAPGNGSTNANGQPHDALPLPDASGIAVNRGGNFPYDLWAPGVAKVGATWVMFYALRVDGDGRRCLWYATSSSPMGPYTNPTYFYCSGDPMGSIDPQPFVDTDGTPYLVWKDEGLVGGYGQRIWARRITVGAPGANAVEFASGSYASLLLESDDSWEAYVAESPSVVRYQGRLLLFYSGNSWDSDAYATGLAHCTSLEGPGPLCHRDAANPVLAHKWVYQKSTGAPSAFIAADGSLRVAYHWWRYDLAPHYPSFPACSTEPNYGCSENQRRMSVERVHFQFGRALFNSDPGVTGAATAVNFTPVEPNRRIDTRLRPPDPKRVDRSEVRTVDLTGHVPADATAVVLNVTAVDAVATGWLTVYPCGDAPYVSNVNYTAQQTTPNLVTVRLNAARKVCIYAHEPVHIIVDLAGSFGPSGPSRFVPLDPTRAVDTRLGIGRPTTAKVAAGTAIEIPLRGLYGIPADATAAVVNLTAADADAVGYLTAYPCTYFPAVVSNVNYVANRAVPNLATVRLSADGKICIFSERNAHVIVDVFGAYAPSGAQFVPTSPARIIDTRAGAPLGAGEIRRFPIAGSGGVPPNASAVVVNVTADRAEAPGYLTVFPCGGGAPVVSNLNFAPGQALANLVQVRLTGGDLCMSAEQPTHVLADVAGYFVS
jgi:hypothetical protein